MMTKNLGHWVWKWDTHSKMPFNFNIFKVCLVCKDICDWPSMRQRHKISKSKTQTQKGTVCRDTFIKRSIQLAL